MSAIKKRQRCSIHFATGRSWEEYVFGYINYQGKEIWLCKQCKERDEKWMENYEKQKKIQEQQQEIRSQKFYEKSKKRAESIVNDLWDHYVIKQLIKSCCRGNANLYSKMSNLVPKELIQYKRAVIKLQRLINTKKDTIRNNRKKINNLRQNGKFKESYKLLIENKSYCSKHFVEWTKDTKKNTYFCYICTQNKRIKNVSPKKHKGIKK